MEHSLVSIKQEPVDISNSDGYQFSSVAHQDSELGSGNEPSASPRNEVGDGFPTQWQAVEGLVSIENASRIKQPIKGRLYICSECEYQASRADVLKHQRLHTKARPYVCLLCNFAGTQNSHLRSHFKRHHTAPLDDDNHMIIPQRHFICQQCHIIFPTQEKLQTHIGEAHGNEEQSPSHNEEDKNNDDTHVDTLQKNQSEQLNGGVELYKSVFGISHRNSEQESSPKSNSCNNTKYQAAVSPISFPPLQHNINATGGNIISKDHMLHNDAACSSKRTNSDSAYAQSTLSQERQSTVDSTEGITYTSSSFTQNNAFGQNRIHGSTASTNPCDDSISQQYVVYGNNMSEYRSFAYEDHQIVAPSSGDTLLPSVSKKRKTFKCSECGYHGGRKDVEKHLTVHTGFHPYVCLLCSHTTAQNSHMRQHFKKAHPGEEVEFDIRMDEFYTCSSCFYFFLSEENFNKHFSEGTCVWLGSTSSNGLSLPDQEMVQSQMQNNCFYQPATSEVTKDCKEDHIVNPCDTSYKSHRGTMLQKAHDIAQRNKQIRNFDPKYPNSNGTISVPRGTHSDITNHFRCTSDVENDRKESELISWSTKPPSHQFTVTSVCNVSQQTHTAVPSLDRRNKTNRTVENQERVSPHSQNHTSRIMQNSMMTVPSRTSTSLQNGKETVVEEGVMQKTPGVVKKSVANDILVGGIGAQTSQMLGKESTVSVCSDSSSVIMEQNRDMDVSTACAAAASSTSEKSLPGIPRNIRKAARRSLQKYTKTQKRHPKTTHEALHSNRRKPIRPFVWHFQGRSYITYEIAGKTSRSLPKCNRQMECNFCPYKTGKKELLQLHMRRHLWMP